MKYMKLEKRFKEESRKVDKKNEEILKLKAKLHETQQSNEKLKAQLEAYQAKEQHLDVI